MTFWILLPVGILGLGIGILVVTILNRPEPEKQPERKIVPTVETVAALLQMRGGKLHPSINIDNMDPEVDLDVCANEAQQYEVKTMVKNSFGFGGINCCSLFRRYEG